MKPQYTYGVVHGMARCFNCAWETESYKNTQALAAKHARATGHHVEGELGIKFSYTGIKEGELGIKFSYTGIKFRVESREEQGNAE